MDPFQAIWYGIFLYCGFAAVALLPAKTHSPYDGAMDEAKARARLGSDAVQVGKTYAITENSYTVSEIGAVPELKELGDDDDE